MNPLPLLIVFNGYERMFFICFPLRLYRQQFYIVSYYLIALMVARAKQITFI